jgi:hypothetical protein
VVWALADLLQRVAFALSDACYVLFLGVCHGSSSLDFRGQLFVTAHFTAKPAVSNFGSAD